MNGRPTATAAGKIDVGGDLTVNRLGFGAMRITGPGIWGEPPDRDRAIQALCRAVALDVNFIDTADSYGPEVSERLIAEALYPYPEELVIATKGGLVRPGPGPEAALVWEMYQDEMREVETVTDPLRKAGNTGGSRPEDRIQNRVDEQSKRHFRRVAQVIDQLLRTDGYDVLVVGGHEYELGEFFRLLPHELRGRVAGTFSADPVATPVAEIRSSAEGVMRRYQHEQDQRLVDHVLELAAAGGLAAVGPQDCLWAGSVSAIDTLLVRDGTTLPGVVCDESRWLAASGDICPVCGKPTRYAPDVLDELAVAVIETGGSARQIAADLMPEEYPTAAQLRFPPPPREAGDSQP